jgi:copper chaperone CopZ
MKNTMLPVALFLGFISMPLSALPSLAGEGCRAPDAAAAEGAGDAAATKTVASADDKVYVLGIEGMNCPINCAPNVQKSIQGIEGVRSVEVKFEEKKAVVHTAPDVDLTTAQIDKSFNNQGYFVSSIAVEGK